MIYELALLLPAPIIVKWRDLLPMGPPLLSICKQIREEASSVYGKNHLEIQLMNLNITKVTSWMGLSPPRMALYQGSEMELSMVLGSRHGELPGGSPWDIMLTWVELYYQQRCRRIVDLPTKDSENNETTPKFKPSHHVELAVKIFDMIDELLEKDSNMTLAKLRKAVSKHRVAMSRDVV